MYARIRPDLAAERVTGLAVIVLPARGAMATPRGPGVGCRMLLRRRATLPDPARVARALRAPELGPRILFFSGGSALRQVSRRLKTYTHNSIHLVTPFDSGGSSATLRAAFGMLSVGDLRNRLIALADETQRGNPAVYHLLSHRFPSDVSEGSLEERLDALIAGSDPLMIEVPEPLRALTESYLKEFRRAAPASFDLRGASVGNLMLVGGYLANGRDIDPVLWRLTNLIEALGDVRPVVSDDLHLQATLADGSVLVGQHRITGNGVPPPAAPIRALSLVRSLEAPSAATVDAPAHVASLIRGADVICFPVGSFFTSVVANLLPRGIGRAVAAAECPKVFVPNGGDDPEMRGMSVADAVLVLLRTLGRDGGDLAPRRLLDAVLLDVRDESYARPLDVERIQQLGVAVLRLPLTRDPLGRRCDPALFSEALLSLA